MRITEDIANKIEQYLNGSLTGNELTSFENQIASDPELAKEIELQEIVNDSIFDNGLLNYKDKIAGDLKKIKQRRLWLQIGLIGFGVLSTVLLTYILWPVDKTEVYLEESKIVDDKKSEPTVPIATHSEEPLSSEPIINKSIVIEMSEDSVDSENSITAIDTGVNETITVYPITDNGASTNTIETVDVCANVKINASISEVQPCNSERTGVIKIKNITGGRAPYLCSIDKSKNYSKQHYFTGLASGDYCIAIQDADGCENIIDKNYHLYYKHCLKELTKPQNTFTPAKGFSPDFEKWLYEDSEGRNFDLQIYNKKGELIKEFNLATLVEWDGTNNSMQRVETGLYVYIVKIEGSTAKKGTVTVLN